MLLGGAPFVGAQQTPAGDAPKHGAAAWSSPQTLQEYLAAEIIKHVSSLNDDGVKHFVSKAENRRLLYLYYLASVL